MWEFRQIRDNAIKQLHGYVSSKPVTFILLGNKYQIPTWVIEGYRFLITSSRLSSAKQLKFCGDNLGWEVTAKIVFLSRKQLFTIRELEDSKIREAFKILC
jgi:hypothetical protein